jgi:hypothetical protein
MDLWWKSMGLNGDILGYGDVHMYIYIFIKRERDRKERKKEGRKEGSID